MLKSYKYLIIFLILSVYTVGVSWVTNGVVEYHYLEKELVIKTEALKVIANNKELAASIDKNFQDMQTKMGQFNQALNKKAEDEIKLNPQYSDCRTSDGMLDTYRKKRQLQQSTR